MNARVISFHYTLTDPKGETLDSSTGRSPLSYVEGQGQIIPGLEIELAKLNTGDKKRIEVKAQHAYGLRNSDLVFEVAKDRLPSQEIKVGDRFRSHASPVPLTVTKVTDSHVTLDANHPLADVDLTFDVEVTEMREATDEDLAPSCGGSCSGCGHDEEHSREHGGCCGH
jgi:FKBP-type peptidyl-prolyl cis-trans isomerase SlyD